MTPDDRLFEAADALRAVEADLTAAFAAAGYREVVVPLVEDAGVYPTGATMRLVQGDRVLALRADFTGPVARLVSTRLAHQAGPIRLGYRGALFRDGHQRWQAGCELFGVRGADGDAEAIRVGLAALAAAGVPDARVVLGSVAAIRAVDPEALDDPSRRAALDRRDRAALADRPALAALFAPGASAPEIEAVLDRLGSLADRVQVEPAHVRRFPYYSGSVFDFFAPGFPRPLGGGGRYDGLCALYGAPRPAVGFSLDVDLLAAGRRR